MFSIVSTAPHIKLVLDWTFAVQLVLFVVLVSLLHFLVFKPILKVLRRRAEAIQGSQGYVRELEVRASEKLKEYEELLANAHEEASAMREEIRRVGELKREELLTAGRHEVARLVREAKERLDREMLNARVELEDYIEELSEEVTRRILEGN